jgi:hypothetical protein
MGLKDNFKFLSIFIITTAVLSYIAYQPTDIKIGGPNFPQLEYFEEELDLMAEDFRN